MAYCWRCSFAAFAEVLDQFSGIECYSGTAVGLHLQKFWINLTESNVMMALERRFGRPDSVKLTLERLLEQPCGTKLALEGLWVAPTAQNWHWNGALGYPGGVKLALERRLGGQITSSWPWNGAWGDPGTPENEVQVGVP